MLSIGGRSVEGCECWGTSMRARLLLIRPAYPDIPGIAKSGIAD